MKTPQELEKLVPTLKALQRLIERFESQGIIIGGAAICLLGQPRMTADVDAMFFVSIDDLPRLLTAAGDVGFIPRHKNVHEFARRNRLVLLHHPETDADVDISLGALPFESEAIQRSQIVRSGNLRLRLPSVEDLIIFKAVAHRPKDMLDIQNMVELYPKLDKKRIERWVKDFADVLEMPELWDDVARLLKK